MLRIRTMTADDLPLGDRLRAQAGWNQTLDDWRRFLALEPEGCFVAEADGRPAGTTVACIFGHVAWVAMVLVDKALRGQGIGTRLMEHALGWLDRRRVPTVRLDATPLGRPIYLKLGFVEEYELARYVGQVSNLSDDPVRSTGWKPVLRDLDAICRLDALATATPRQRLLEAFFDGQRSGNTAAAYVMYRPGCHAVQIGPAVALEEPSGRALVDWALDRCAGSPVSVDIPLANRPAIQWAFQRGLAEQRRFVRMCRGPRVADRPEWIWASSGPELG
jgi:GNAT superfamily N-acetyltransferase